MKTRLLLLASVLCILSCSVKEDRMPCPCLLRLDFGIAARYARDYSVKGWGFGKSLFGESIHTDDWPDGWTVRVPKGEMEYCACSGLTYCVMKGNAVIVPEGHFFDEVWACHRQLTLSEEETVDRVIPHKQWAEVTVLMKNIPDGELTTEVTGNSVGFYLADLTPAEGPFRAVISNEGRGTVSFNIPRQDDNDLIMTLSCDGVPVKTYELGRMIAETGYDWHAEDLDDIYLGMDYNKLEMEIGIEPWHGGDVYEEVRSVSIVPYTDGMSVARSSYGWSESEINDIQLLVVDGGGGTALYYYPDFDGGISIPLMTGRSYRITAAANIGESIGIEEMLGLDNGTWRPDIKGVAHNGIPMTGSSESFVVTTEEQTVSIPVKRMLARIDFSVSRSRLDSPDGLSIKSVCLYDGSNGQYDHASEADLRSLQEGSLIQLYTYENLMGDLLPGNRDPWAKVPSSIGKDADRCSWLEVKCSYTNGYACSNDITYRMYLGKDATSNFDVRRNTVYTLTLIPSETEIGGSRGSWKISSSGWTSRTSYGYRLEIINGGDLFVGDEATFEVKLYTDTYYDGRLYSKDHTGEKISNSRLRWGFGYNPYMTAETSSYARFTGPGILTGTKPGKCTVLCALPEDISVYATKDITILERTDSTEDTGIDLSVQWGPGNYRIGFDF